ncbi:MAG: M50 family metallopeptidase, partial [Candidatus Omnitrophota bacterium]|nr:M50 family metallopeptidase [Candidatus Omnitrophota bacterium]
MNFLIFLIVLSILIIVHEFGHLVIAKLLGVRVEKFSLGFGPRIISFKRKFTEYSLSLIPLGGYVKLAGDSREEFKGSHWEYLAKPPGERAAIVFFGPVLNYFLAFLFFYIVFLIGYPTLSAKVGDLLDGFPAAKSGLLKEDTIIAVEGQRVSDWEEMQEAIRSKKEGTIEIVALRNKREMKFVITPRIEKLKNIFGQEESVRLIGIKPKDEFIKLKYNFADSFIMASKKLWMVTAVTFKALWRMLTGAMSFKESVTGPLGIFYLTSKAWELGISYLLQVMAILSASLAIFNVLPLPILDGGHLFLLAVEKIRKRP